MAKVKLKHNGDGTYKALIIEDKYQTLYDRVKMNMEILRNDDGTYGTVSAGVDEDIAHIDEWDWDFETNRLTWK